MPPVHHSNCCSLCVLFSRQRDSMAFNAPVNNRCSRDSIVMDLIGRGFSTPVQKSSRSPHPITPERTSTQKSGKVSSSNVKGQHPSHEHHFNQKQPSAAAIRESRRPVNSISHVDAIPSPRRLLVIPDSLLRQMYLQERADRLYVERLFVIREEHHQRQQLALEAVFGIEKLQTVFGHKAHELALEAKHCANLEAIQRRLEEDSSLSRLRRELAEATQRLHSERDVVRTLQREVLARSEDRRAGFDREKDAWMVERANLHARIGQLSSQSDYDKISETHLHGNFHEASTTTLPKMLFPDIDSTIGHHEQNELPHDILATSGIKSKDSAASVPLHRDIAAMEPPMTSADATRENTSGRAAALLSPSPLHEVVVHPIRPDSATTKDPLLAHDRRTVGDIIARTNAALVRASALLKRSP